MLHLFMQPSYRRAGLLRQALSVPLGRPATEATVFGSWVFLNGDKIDNTVGPCLLARECRCPDGPHNLELWSKMQPSGKRIADLIAYAKEILSRYG
jgi:hypothetical protein